MKVLCKLLCLCFYWFCIQESWGGNNALQSSNLNKWQHAYWKTCEAFYVESDHPCIGPSKNACKAKSWVTPAADDEYGISMMIAVDTTEGGAKFCPISIVGANEKRGNAWTEYYSAGDGCVWLCRQGWTGEKCSEKEDNVTTCDSTRLLQSNYDNISKTDESNRSNIENNIVNWGANNYDGCGLNKGQEHDLIFAISDWLPSGHGAFVRPYMVRAQREGWPNLVSWINIYPASSVYQDKNTKTIAQIACKNGYKPNDDGTDCVIIREGLCSLDYCAGWKQTGFDEKKHYEVAVNGCYQYRCKETGYGFDANKNCVDCGSSMRDGISPKDGTCVHCEIGKIFSAYTEDTSYCAESTIFDNNRLLYGPNGSQNSKIEDQCWTKSDLTDYRNCVLGNQSDSDAEE
ncbi:MAG: hypothetical protein MJ158_03125 [Alphaproteobacteria bacterium]|nr:hypothetical protein [Alphaproteobacteria bacterium]